MPSACRRARWQQPLPLTPAASANRSSTPCCRSTTTPERFRQAARADRSMLRTHRRARTARRWPDPGSGLEQLPPLDAAVRSRVVELAAIERRPRQGSVRQPGRRSRRASAAPGSAARLQIEQAQRTTRTPAGGTCATLKAQQARAEQAAGRSRAGRAQRPWRPTSRGTTPTVPLSKRRRQCRPPSAGARHCWPRARPPTRNLPWQSRPWRSSSRRWPALPTPSRSCAIWRRMSHGKSSSSSSLQRWTGNRAAWARLIAAWPR